ncbi:ubiquitinyl hydrolase 1 [Entamoeba marina]
MDVYIDHESVIQNKLELEKPVDLKDCLNCYQLPVELSHENGWLCPVCKKIQNAQKKTTIVSTPQYLIIVLKRFVLNGKKWVKSAIDVKFPFEGLQAKDFLDVDSKGLDDVYDLYSIINHRGTMNNGHYTTITKTDADRWVRFDDKTITEIDEDKIPTLPAYILFYEKRNPKMQVLVDKYNISVQKDLLQSSCIVV